MDFKVSNVFLYRFINALVIASAIRGVHSTTKKISIMDPLQIALCLVSISPLFSLFLQLHSGVKGPLRIIVYDVHNRSSFKEVSINLTDEPTSDEIDRFVKAIQN